MPKRRSCAATALLAMAARLVCVCSTWRRGRVRSRVEDTPEDPLLASGCLHELPPSAQPVGTDTQKRVLLLHEARLGPGSSRCALDARPALRKALRERELPVRVLTEPPDVLTGELGSTQQLTVRDVVQRLAKELPGAWQLFEEGVSEPLVLSHRLLRDALHLPSASAREVVLRAVRESPAALAGERVGRLAKRLRAAEALATDTGAAPPGERAAARRGAERLRGLLADCEERP